MNSYTESNRQIEEVVDKVERLPEEKRQLVFQKLEVYQGDLPHPEILKGYAELYPDAAKKIIDNGIAEIEHRRQMELRALKGQTSDRNLGQILGFVVAVLIMCGGVYLILNNHQVTGSIMPEVSAIGVVGLFTGNSNNDNNKESN